MLQNHKDQYAKGKISIGVRSGDHSGVISIAPDVQSLFFEKPHQRSCVHMLWNGEGLHHIGSKVSLSCHILVSAPE